MCNARSVRGNEDNEVHCKDEGSYGRGWVSDQLKPVSFALWRS